MSDSSAALLKGPAAVEASLVTVPAPAFPGGELRQFQSININAAIDRALSNIIEPGRTGAVVLHTDLEGVKLVVGMKEGHWSVVAAAGYDWNGPLSAEAEVRYSW